MSDDKHVWGASASLPDSLQELIAVGTVRHFQKRSILINEGDEGNSVYFILQGRVKAFSRNLDGKEFIYATYGPGDIFGEMAIDDKPRSASVEALTELTCAVIPITKFKDKIRTDADFALRLIVTLIGRSRVATEQARSLALQSVYERVRMLLHVEAAEQDGAMIVRGLASQQDIADRIGASRDMISKVFKELVKGGYVDYSRQQIRLLKPLPSRW